MAIPCVCLPIEVVRIEMIFCAKIEELITNCLKSKCDVADLGTVEEYLDAICASAGFHDICNPLFLVYRLIVSGQ